MRRAFAAIRGRAAEVDLATVLEEPARGERDAAALELAVRRSRLLRRLERALAFTCGLVLSFCALLIEGRAFARYPDWRDLLCLMVAAIVENFGCRQWLSLVRARAILSLLEPAHG